MNNTQVVNTSKFTLFTLGSILTIIFVLLKVFNIIAWSWWLVFTPLIVVVGLQIILIIVIVILSAIG